MKYCRILLCMMTLVCLAFQAFAQSDPLGESVSGSTMGSSRDYLSPNIGQKYPQDWLEGGYVTSSSHTSHDPALAEMLQWLDRPVPNFPWYSSVGAFYSQAVPITTFSPFTEYYVTSGMPVVGGLISNPTKFDITQKMPSNVYYGAGQGLPYTQYASIMPSKTNDLWVQGATNWTQYLVSPLGTMLQLVANVPIGGPVGFYEIVQTDTTSSKYKTYQFYQGYNTMNFVPDQIGRHMLYFVVNNQPSNVVVVDVFGQASPAQDLTQSSYVQLTGPSTQRQTHAAIPTTPIVSRPSQAATFGGDTPVTIQSQGMRGYQVFLDENYIGTEGTEGDVLDGIFNFKVTGGKVHDIRVNDGQFNYPKSMYFDRGVLKIINVEPGTAAYI
ncbi:MAG: hypothetical protein LUQ38_07370 [Methanotrichaceae archaeon]|nr:hypothetical protein [Methanotrichaceae archaeon]